MRALTGCGMAPPYLRAAADNAIFKSSSAASIVVLALGGKPPLSGEKIHCVSLKLTNLNVGESFSNLK